MKARGKPTPLSEAESRKGTARLIRVKRGEQPSHSALTGFETWAWNRFRNKVSDPAQPVDPGLEENLLKAHMRIRGEEYRAKILATMLVGGIAVLVVAAVLGFILALFVSVEVGLILAVVIGIPGVLLTYLIVSGAPSSGAKKRGKLIDSRISAAMSFVSAMSSADVNVDQIFRELAKQKIYGEVAEEAAWITRDTEFLGVDILTAIKDAAIRTPSKRFQDFLQGVVTTATSGGQLKPYFLAKAEQFEQEHKLDMLSRVETMGLLAETFVTVVVAFPLFLVIIIAIFAIIGGGGTTMITILFAIVGIMIPASQGGFIYFMHELAKEF